VERHHLSRILIPFLLTLTLTLSRLTAELHPSYEAEMLVVEMECENGGYARSERNISRQTETMVVTGDFDGECNIILLSLNDKEEVVDRLTLTRFVSP
jgi:hypothetical protein